MSSTIYIHPWFFFYRRGCAALLHPRPLWLHQRGEERRCATCIHIYLYEKNIFEFKFEFWIMLGLSVADIGDWRDEGLEYDRETPPRLLSVLFKKDWWNDHDETTIILRIWTVRVKERTAMLISLILYIVYLSYFLGPNVLFGFVATFAHLFHSYFWPSPLLLRNHECDPDTVYKSNFLNTQSTYQKKASSFTFATTFVLLSGTERTQKKFYHA